MAEEIFSPLSDYRKKFHDKFVDAAKRAFKEFADTAQVDAEANSQTCSSINHFQELLRKTERALKLWWTLGITLGVLALASFLLWYFEVTPVWVPIAIVVAVVLLEIFWIYKKISRLNKEKVSFSQEVFKFTKEAYAQMEPLNSLYDDEIFHRLVKEVTPIVSLDPYFKASDMQSFSDDFGWHGYDNPMKSAVNLQSGKINGNPFLICRRLVHFMGQKTYTGSITVSVTKTRTVNGETERYVTTETLTANVTKPYPEYANETEVVYANQAAPELTFSREKNKSSKKEGSLSYKFTEWKLRRKSKKLDQDFSMMTNEEFEVLFTTPNRNDNHQYALLFTPLAQENMIDLIRDEENVGFGDDFDFKKNGRINTIISDHMQVYDLDWTPRRLQLYEYARAEETFVNVYLEAFKGLYFALAPLLSIPLYQQMDPDYDVRMHRPLQPACDTLQQEVLAYYWGVDQFKSPDCVTNCILKTSSEKCNDGSSLVNVISYGYRSVPRVDYVTRYDSNGRRHSVPVHWDEYIPVEGGGCFSMKETGSYPEEAKTPKQRFEYSAEKLKEYPGAVLHRQIATWLGRGPQADDMPPVPPSYPGA